MNRRTFTWQNTRIFKKTKKTSYAVDVSLLYTTWLNDGQHSSQSDRVFAEFNQIGSKNLEGDFFEALDQYTPRLIDIFKTKKGTVGRKLIELMQHMSWMTPDVTVLRSVVPKGILMPKMLCKDSQLHSDCDAWTGKEKPPTKTVNSEEQSPGLD
ncbi:uncharacterized protein LOC144383573 isoform X2 [Gasterosteus aculeatus]